MTGAMAQPHILIPIHDFNHGGTEAIAFRLAGEWLARGWRVSVLAGDGAGPMRGRVPAGAEVHVLNPPVPRSTFSRLRLGRAMAQQAKAIAPDVIFIIGNFHFILAHALKRALPGVPIVAKTSNPLLPGGLSGRLLAAPGAAVLRRFLAPVDHATALSRGLAREFSEAAPAIPVSMIHDPNVPDDTVIPPMRDRRAGADPIELLLIGRFEPQKDIALALHTLAALNRHRDARLTVLGDGEQRAMLEALARRLGIADRLSLPGFSNDVSGAMAKADLLLISSGYEGVPGVAVEALAAALPVVSTDCSYFLTETLVDPRLGRLVPGRDPAALAAGILAQMAEPPAPPEVLKSATDSSRYGIASEAYLALFEGLLASKSA